MWNNDIKCKYMFMFPLLNLARKELTCWIVFKIIKDVFTSLIISWIMFNKRRLNSHLDELYMLHILYCQYHTCWCPRDLKSQGISRHGIDQISRNIPCPASGESKWLSITVSQYKQDLLTVMAAIHVLSFTLYKVLVNLITEQNSINMLTS